MSPNLPTMEAMPVTAMCKAAAAQTSARKRILELMFAGVPGAVELRVIREKSKLIARKTDRETSGWDCSSINSRRFQLEQLGLTAPLRNVVRRFETTGAAADFSKLPQANGSEDR